MKRSDPPSPKSGITPGYRDESRNERHYELFFIAVFKLIYDPVCEKMCLTFVPLSQKQEITRTLAIHDNSVSIPTLLSDSIRPVKLFSKLDEVIGNQESRYSFSLELDSSVSPF